MQPDKIETRTSGLSLYKNSGQESKINMMVEFSKESPEWHGA